jgi:threonine dehydrogenase-like Zn-dependent dehydrogenase
METYADDLAGFITHRLPLAEAGQAYRLLDQGSPDVLQVLIDYRK